MSEELASLKFTHPAGIITRALNNTELLTLAKDRAPDPAAFDEYPPLFLSLEATSNRLDAYYTRMAVSSLKNYALEAADGVSFQDSHLTDGLAFMMGRSLTGEFKGSQGNGVARVLADIYTIQNLPETNNFISKYRTGIAKDVSIGFYGGRFICSICGMDMMSWDCWHYPGREYEVEEENDDDSKTIRKVIATADVEDAHLAEISAVYKGATPGAVIIKALRDVEEGRMKPEVARFLEQRYRHLNLNLSRTRRAFPGHTPSEEETRGMPQPNNNQPGQAGANGTGEAAPGTTSEGAGAAGTANADETRATPPPAGTTAPPPAAPTDTATAPGADDEARMLTRLRAVMAERGIAETTLPATARVIDLAVDGLTYRNDLIESAHAEGVRAMGATAYKRDQHDKTFRSAEIDYIKLMRDDWKRQADANLKGGRLTADTQTQPAPKPRVPDSAYRARAK